MSDRIRVARQAVRDYGLLEAALARPQATVFGKDAYPDLGTDAYGPASLGCPQQCPSLAAARDWPAAGQTMIVKTYYRYHS